MKNTTKGALAAAAAGSLLLGGAGSLAYWTGTSDVAGGDISSGEIAFSPPVCKHSVDGDTHDWQYANTTSELDLTNAKLVPGDVLTKVCKTTLTLAGDHIGASLGVTQPTFGTAPDPTNTLDTELKPVGTFTVDGSAYTGPFTAAGTHTVLATVTVTFTGADATDGSQDVAATLNAYTITATQTHTP